MTTPGSGGGDTDDDRWPAEPAPPDGEQATTALPRRTGSYPYPYPEPAAHPEPASHPEADHRPPAAAPEPWQGPPATPPTGWAQPTGSAQPTGWTPPAYAPPASRPPSGPGWVAPATLPPGGPWPTGGAYDRPPYPDARPYDPTRAAPTEQHDATVPRYQPPPRGSHLPPYEEPLGPSAGPHPAPGEWPQPAPTGTGDADTDPRRTGPRKLTVTRVAAFRSRELTTRGVRDLPARGGRRRRGPLGPDGPDLRRDGATTPSTPRWRSPSRTRCSSPPRRRSPPERCCCTWSSRSHRSPSSRR